MSRPPAHRLLRPRAEALLAAERGNRGPPRRLRARRRPLPARAGRDPLGGPAAGYGPAARDWLRERQLTGLPTDDARAFLRRDHVSRHTNEPFSMPAELEQAILRVTAETGAEPVTTHHP